jgi:hypothetical protein
MHYTRVVTTWQHGWVQNMSLREAAPRQGVYILRFWETRSFPPDAPVTWRFSAQDPRTGERRGFADLDGLMAFLAARTGEQAGPSYGRAFPGPGLADNHAADRGGGPLASRDYTTDRGGPPADVWSADSPEQNTPTDHGDQL